MGFLEIFRALLDGFGSSKTVLWHPYMDTHHSSSTHVARSMEAPKVMAIENIWILSLFRTSFWHPWDGFASLFSVKMDTWIL